MADIFLAKSISEGGVERFVVLKRVLAERSRDPHFAKMFLDEARLAAQLQHPNIAQVHDIGKLGESYFFTMEYVHGEDMRAIGNVLAKPKVPMPIPFALHVAAGALAALHHAHERRASDGKRLNVVHRDVSPSNVMVSYEGTVKLLDFGVAKATQNNAETRAGTVKGKVAYLSPEQTNGSPVDRRSDIFALGILLWEMLTGARLYRRENDFTTMVAISSEEPAPPSSIRAVAPELDRIVLTALAKEPAARFATAADMLETIENFAAREGHVLSATSASRFMRERFGSPPEPWLELLSMIDSSVTVHGEAIAELGLDGQRPESTRLLKANPRDAEARKLIEQQLQQAPAIHRSPVLPTSSALRPHPTQTHPPAAPNPFADDYVPPPSTAARRAPTTPNPFEPEPAQPQAPRRSQPTGPQPFPPGAQPPYVQPYAPAPSAQQPFAQPYAPSPAPAPSAQQPFEQPYAPGPAPAPTGHTPRPHQPTGPQPFPATPYPPARPYVHPGVQHVPEDTVEWLRSSHPGPAPTGGGGAPANAPYTHAPYANAPYANPPYANAPMHTPPRQLRDVPPPSSLRMPIIVGVAVAMITLGILIAILVGN